MFLFLSAIFAAMLAEAWISRRHERELRAMGAVEAPRDVYEIMLWAYPLCFVLIGAESVITDRTTTLFWPGVALFAAAKGLKWWAIATLGTRWSFRVLVVPDRPLIVAGPYRYLRHPNYLAVVGEIAAAALALEAPSAGLAALVGFGALMWRRIIIEERMLKLR